MKQLLTIAIALISFTINAVEPMNLVGSWVIQTENGEWVSDVNDYGIKTYLSNGEFNVSKHKRQSDNTYKCIILQRGQWEVVNDSILIEKCAMGSKGDVTINYNIKDSRLTETFSYNSNPEKIYVQEWDLYSRPSSMLDISNASLIGEDILKGIGRENASKHYVYFIDVQRYDKYDDFISALPSYSSKVDGFIVKNDSEALNMLTPEEKNLGKSGVIIVTLKK